MPTYNAPNKDFQFLIDHFLELENHMDVPGIAEGRELAPALLDESAKLCQDVLQPLNVVGDKQGLKMDGDKVVTPDGFKEAYKMYIEGGWSTLTWPTEFGGQDMPEFVNMPLLEMVCSANLSFGLTPGLNHGAISLLLSHASDELKQKYLPNMVAGTWTGVMCLTEPGAGTDLGLVKTRATPNDNGTYSIEGSKIWISSGEQDMSENIIHLVLARLPDAPAGSKGISLFLCPKFFVNDDGSLGDRNQFSCASTEHKMGIHASPSCAMNYDGATGWLVGEAHRGLPAMFTMMNAARLYVGVQGLGVGEVAYQNALAYTKERLQGRALLGAKNPDKPADPITVHPDVRRMLYTMKAFTEGGRALTMWTALQIDIAHRHPDPKKREEADDLVQLLTPIVKAHLTDGGFETASTAMQCLGGYGYCEEYGMSQFLRDSRIAMIYEGTNGVQSMDLVGRKLGYDTGRYLSRFFHPLDAFIAENRDNPDMAEFTKALHVHAKYLQQATMWIGSMGLANPNHAGAGAVEYLRMFALVIYAYIWAKQAKIAFANRDQDPEFYDAKIATARFFFKKILPGTTALLASITAGADCVMDEAGF